MVPLTQLATGLEPAHPGEREVQDDDVGRSGRREFEALLGGLGEVDLVVARRQHRLERTPNLLLVVDDEDALCSLRCAFGAHACLLDASVGIVMTKRAPCGSDVLNPDRPTVRSHDLAGDRQTESGARRNARRTRSHGRTSRTRSGFSESGTPGPESSTQSSAASCNGSRADDHHGRAGRVQQRVLDEIRERPRQLREVRSDLGQVLGELEAHPVTLRRRQAARAPCRGCLAGRRARSAAATRRTRAERSRAGRRWSR